MIAALMWLAVVTVLTVVGPVVLRQLGRNLWRQIRGFEESAPTLVGAP